MKERDLRRKLLSHLLNNNWVVLEEVPIEKDGLRGRADLVASHPEYKDLGWFLFEIKKDDLGFAEAFTKAHKQIVRYVGVKFADHRLAGARPTVFVYCFPSPGTRWLDTGEAFIVLRFFNRYGIGLLPWPFDSIIFNPNMNSKLDLHLDPRKNSQWFDVLQLKKYLEARTFGPE